MNIIFAGSTGKTGSIIFKYLKEKGFDIISEINRNSPPLEKVIKENSVIIDFTNKDAAYNHALLCLKNNCHFICGTTAIEAEKIDYLLKEAKSKNLTFVFNPNFSTSISPICKFINEQKVNFPITKISESHHISKKDLPSGTALLLKKFLFKDTQIDSIRTTYPTLDHTIKLESECEEITITHKVKNKLAYAKGVETTLNKIINKK